MATLGIASADCALAAAHVQVMAIGTLAICYNNGKVFEGE